MMRLDDIAGAVRAPVCRNVMLRSMSFTFNVRWSSMVLFALPRFFGIRLLLAVLSPNVSRAAHGYEEQSHVEFETIFKTESKANKGNDGMTKALDCGGCSRRSVESGELGVAGGNAVAERIPDYVNAHRSEYAYIATTQDWHIGGLARTGRRSRFRGHVAEALW